VAYAEGRCDGLDNDCNGAVDEDFLPLKGAACADSNIGICQGFGTYGCKSDLSGTECKITSPGLPASAEVCDNLDNDCDGLTDEPSWNRGTNASYVTDEVEVVSVSGHNVFVYSYEASRPAATAVDPGVGNPRACSRPDVLPWNRVTYAQAQAACAAAGARLCKADEWQAACEGSPALTFPYGNTYEDMTCNGSDYLMDVPIPTGDAVDCFSGSTYTYDMSGNLREWTQDYRGQTADGESLFTLRGGSYLDYEAGLTCQFDGSVYVESAFTPHVGFRCCSTCGNGTLESDELCDDGNRVNGDGCDYLCATSTGQTCGNGTREGTEQCDDGNRVNGDGCSSACRWDYVVPVCGNGVKEAGENCDDGNAVNGDGCNTNCTVCNGVFDAFGYERCTGGATFTDIRATGTKLGTGDTNTYTVNLPFTYWFYGRSYTTVLPSDNGEIHFTGGATDNNADIPTTQWQAAIMVFWDDLYSGNDTTNEGTWYQITGTAPNRTLIVQWRTRQWNTRTVANPASFEIQIREGTNHISFVYQDVVFGNASYNYGISATVGIQGYSPMSYYHKYSYNTASLADGQVFTYYHP